MPPPPEDTYDTFEDAIHICQSWAKEHGYALSKVATIKEYKGGPYKQAYLQCDRAESIQALLRFEKQAPNRLVACLSYESHG
jgi:hypothetical protein